MAAIITRRQRKTDLNLPKSVDGKLLVQMSPRLIFPVKTYTYWTGRGDDIANTVRGQGQKFQIEMTSSGTEQFVDLMFLTDSEIAAYQAYVAWKDAPWDSSVDCWMRAAPTFTFPTENGDYVVDEWHRITYSGGAGNISIANPILVPSVGVGDVTDGFWDYNAEQGTIEYSADQTGAYNLYDIDVEVLKLVNQIPLYDSSYGFLLLVSWDCEPVPPGYYMRLKLTNGNPATDWKFWGFLTLFREETL